MLGALKAQVDLGIGAIGGKDSMSGSFEDLDVPPTLVSFAVGVGNIDRVMSPEFKGAGHRVVSIRPFLATDGITPEVEGLRQTLSYVEKLIGSGAALAVSTPGYGYTAEAVFKMCVGNGVGFEVNEALDTSVLFYPSYGSFIVELADGADVPHSDGRVPAAVGEVQINDIGQTTEAYELVGNGETIDLAELQEAWESALESVFPYREKGETVETVSFTAGEQAGRVARPALLTAKPKVVIPVFPGNNCEFDSARAFRRAGAEAQVFVVNNLTPAAVAESTEALVRAIDDANIVFIPGGFSGGDEPDGSAKFITAFFRAPAVTEAVRNLLQKRDGLMLGICNGFQALVKLGLVPFGDIRSMDDACPTLTFNTIGRHQSRIVRTRVASDMSPWLSQCAVGDIHTVAISHGEGRFVANDEVIAQMKVAGQIATQYVDAAGVPSMDWDVNPNGSVLAIEGITSPDGRVFGKMGHSERSGAGLYRNIPDANYQPIFEGGVKYFTD